LGGRLSALQYESKSVVRMQAAWVQQYSVGEAASHVVEVALMGFNVGHASVQAAHFPPEHV
jgi:hypothetical protein